MSSRTPRTRLLAATTVAFAALALTACQNGEGIRDEGASSASALSDPSLRDTQRSGTPAPCSGAHVRTTATELSRPAGHLLLTVTNTSAVNCTLTGYPKAHFDEARSTPRPAQETKPQASITLSPGESAYAGVVLSSADGTGENGHTAKTLSIDLPSTPPAHPALPAKGVYVDDKLTVTYWMSSREAVLTN